MAGLGLRKHTGVWYMFSTSYISQYLHAETLLPRDWALPYLVTDQGPPSAEEAQGEGGEENEGEEERKEGEEQPATPGEGGEM